MQCVITNLTGVVGPASTQQEGFDFNSMVNFNGMRFGANDLGVHEIFCGQSDPSGAIAAYFILVTDLWMRCEKSARFLYLGLETDGSLDITLTTDSGVTQTIRVTSNRTGQQHIRVPIPRRVGENPFTWRWLTVKIANVNGSDFSIDSISILPLIKSGGA